MDKNNENVPKIRFPRFTGPWQQRKLGDIFEEYSEKNHEELPPLTIIQGRGTIRRDESDRNLQFDKKSLLNYKMVEKDDFIVHLRSFEGGLEKSNFTGIISPAYHTLHGNGADSRFYYAYFRSHNFINIKLKPHVYGVRDGRSIDMAGMKTINIPFTCLNEQKKIGDFIESLDTIITLHQRKLEHLQDKKKVLLQKMFPKDGEKIPELRFPGFDDPWEQRKLNDVAIFIDGNYGEKYPKNNEFIENGVPFFTSAVIGAAGVFDKKNVKYISKEKNSVLVKAQSLGGDIILTNRGASMGVVAQIPLEYGLVNIGPQLTRIRGIEKADNLFLLSMFKNSSYNQKLLSINSGSAMNFIGLEALGKFEFMCPKLDEQAQIGVFFKNIDNLITLHQCKLEHLQQQKKGLLQQMFI